MALLDDFPRQNCLLRIDVNFSSSWLRMMSLVFCPAYCFCTRMQTLAPGCILKLLVLLLHICIRLLQKNVRLYLRLLPFVCFGFKEGFAGSCPDVLAVSILQQRITYSSEFPLPDAPCHISSWGMCSTKSWWRRAADLGWHSTISISSVHSKYFQNDIHLRIQARVSTAHLITSAFRMFSSLADLTVFSATPTLHLRLPPPRHA